MSLAIFDLDETLIAGDSDHGWGEFLLRKGLVDPIKYKEGNDRFYQDYLNSRLDIHAYLRFALEPLTHYSLSQLAELHAEFMRDFIDPLRLDKADALLQQHRQQGDYLLIITSTNLFVTGPIAAALGVDDILASEPEILNDRYTGEVVGTPCYQEGKVTRLKQWLQNYSGDLSGSYFYSDSINDLPLLQQVDKPIAVDPDDKLRQHAESCDWPIISLRD